MDEDNATLMNIELSRIATALKYLGTGDAATSMGAIEVLAMEVKAASERVAEALNNIADAIDRSAGNA